MTLKDTLNIHNTVFTLLAVSLLSACASEPPRIDTDAEMTFDGLAPVQNARADQAWARPGLDLSGYTKIKLESAGLQYRPGGGSSRMWSARRGSGPFEVTPEAKEALREVLGEVFREELAQGKNYTIVDEAGPDVLTLRGAIVDIVSFVPPEAVGRSEVFLSTVGEATLVLELHDSITDAILARSVDRRAAEYAGGDLRWSTTVSNRAEVRRLARRWAQSLRENLDAFMGGD